MTSKQAAFALGAATTFDGYHLATLARLVRAMDSPTTTDLAEFIWRLSNRESLPVHTAREFMTACGYEPFKGFPLTRIGQVR